MGHESRPDIYQAAFAAGLGMGTCHNWSATFWDDYARQVRYRVDTTPEAGAPAVWGSTAPSDPGRVA